MMSGKAIQRAFRGHLLVSQSLTKQITAKVIEDEPDFEILMTELETIYTQAKVSCTPRCTTETDCIKRISQALASKKSELSKYSETSKLLVNYIVPANVVSYPGTSRTRSHRHVANAPTCYI